MDILRKLFFGKILPYEQLCPVSTEYERAVRKSVKMGQQFEASLDEKQNQLYREYMDIKYQVASEELTAAFSQGFRLGMQLMTAAMREEWE